MTPTPPHPGRRRRAPPVPMRRAQRVAVPPAGQQMAEHQHGLRHQRRGEPGPAGERDHQREHIREPVRRLLGQRRTCPERESQPPRPSARTSAPSPRTARRTPARSRASVPNGQHQQRRQRQVIGRRDDAEQQAGQEHAHPPPRGDAPPTRPACAGPDPSLNTPATSATVTVIDAMIGYPPNLIDTPNTDAPGAGVRRPTPVPRHGDAVAPRRPAPRPPTRCTLCASSAPSASASTPACTSRARLFRSERRQQPFHLHPRHRPHAGGVAGHGSHRRHTSPPVRTASANRAA